MYGRKQEESDNRNRAFHYHGVGSHLRNLCTSVLWAGLGMFGLEIDL